MPKREDIFKSEQLGRSLPKAQKIIIIGVLIVAILFFLYSFIFMTPFSDIYQIDGWFSFQSLHEVNPLYTEAYIKELIPVEIYPDAYYTSAITGETIGLNLAYFTNFTRDEFQVFNHWLFTFGFFGLLASLVPLVYFSQKRKIYYKTNLVVVPAVAAFNLYIGIHFLVQLIQSHQLVLSKGLVYDLLNDYEKHITSNKQFHITDGNPIFIIGYVIAAALIIFAIASCLLTYSKYRYQKNQKQIDLSKVVIHE